MEKIPEYEQFIQNYFEICQRKTWFNELVGDCLELDNDAPTVNSIIGNIHEGLRENFDEAVLFFWTVFLTNPLIAIKAYGETDLLGRIDLYNAFKHTPGSLPGSRSKGDYLEFLHFGGNNSLLSDEEMHKYVATYNPYVENYLVFAVEAMLQKTIEPDRFYGPLCYILGILYGHDKAIMSQKKAYRKAGIDRPKKWISSYNMHHILKAINPQHTIFLLDFFAGKYASRLKAAKMNNESIGKYCYSKHKYEYIIEYILNKYGSLSEYIEWDNPQYMGIYKKYYKRMLAFPEILKDIDAVFATNKDKKRIANYCSFDDETH